MRKRLILTVLLLMAVMVGCGEAKQAPVPAPEQNTVLIQNYKYEPAEITVPKGETITWINQDSVMHTATGDSFDSGPLNKGQSFKQVFNESGNFDYICTPHPYMKGKIIVK